eukprot:748639-Hanusia_phi.AAC.2
MQPLDVRSYLGSLLTANPAALIVCFRAEFTYSSSILSPISHSNPEYFGLLFVSSPLTPFLPSLPLLPCAPPKLFSFFCPRRMKNVSPYKYHPPQCPNPVCSDMGKDGFNGPWSMAP